jgi:hypothetical protein
MCGQSVGVGLLSVSLGPVDVVRRGAASVPVGELDLTFLELADPLGDLSAPPHQPGLTVFVHGSAP